MAPNEKKKSSKTPAQSRSALTGSHTKDGDSKAKATASAKHVPEKQLTEDIAGSAQPDKEQLEDKHAQPAAATSESEESLTVSFADELGVEELTDVLHGHNGKIFSAAGRESPVAEFAANGVLLRPAQKPYSDEEPAEVIVFGVDSRGVLLNELGQPRKIVGAKFKGKAIFTLAEIKPGTVKHYAAWFDEQNRTHKLYVQGQALTSDMIFRIRNRTLDGEIGIFSEITTD